MTTAGSTPSKAPAINSSPLEHIAADQLRRHPDGNGFVPEVHGAHAALFAPTAFSTSSSFVANSS
jgi:hypothetical protein